MPAISGADLTLLRADEHRTTERLYVFGFPTVWTGRVNESPDRGDRTITYDGGSLASADYAFADIMADIEVWFGSSSGANDKGRRRLRSISGTETSGDIVVDWHDDMGLADDDYITIVHNYGPWPKYSHFTATGPVFKKDGPDGTTYTDENEDSPPLALMGSNYAAEDAATIILTAEESVATADGATISSYSYSFTPSNLSGASISAKQGVGMNLTLPADSKVWVHCTVTDSNGNTSTCHRAYITGGGITEFSRSALSHRFGSADVSLEITSTSTDITWSDLDDRCLVIIAAEDHYGSTEQSITFRDTSNTRYQDRDHVVFSGYLRGETQRIGQGGAGAVTMQAVTAMPMFLYSVSLTGADSPSEWTQMHTTLMTMAGNLFHLFYYHSTLMSIADFNLPWSDTVKRSANDEFSEGNLLQKASAFAQKRFMRLTGTPTGEIFIEEDLNLADDTTRGATATIITLTDADCQINKNAVVSRQPGSVVVTLSGGSSTGKPGTFTPLFSTSGNVALATGVPNKRSFDRLMLADQTDANDKSGRMAAVINRSLVGISQLSFRGHYRGVFSPAGQEWVNLGLIFDDALIGNIRGDTDLENVLAVVRSVTLSPVINGAYTVTVDLDIEAPTVPTGVGGITVTPPSVPDTTDSTTGDFDDPWNVPTNYETVTGEGHLLLLNDDTNLYITKDGGESYTARAV